MMSKFCIATFALSTGPLQTEIQAKRQYFIGAFLSLVSIIDNQDDTQGYLDRRIYEGRKH